MLKNFYTDVLRKDKRFTSPHPVGDPALLEPGTRDAVIRLIALAQEAGHDLRLNETFRSQALQAAYFKGGVSQLKTVGCHGYGLAADFQLFINGKYQTQAGPYDFLRDLCRKCGLISGIDWGNSRKRTHFVDAGHVQRIPVWRQPALFAGEWYPPEKYDPHRDLEARGGEALA